MITKHMRYLKIDEKVKQCLKKERKKVKCVCLHTMSLMEVNVFSNTKATGFTDELLFSNLLHAPTATAPPKDRPDSINLEWSIPCFAFNHSKAAKASVISPDSVGRPACENP
jgi:hypothetical protein